MSIKINVSSFLDQYTNGERVVQVNGSTVGQCLSHLVKRFPSTKSRLFDNNGKLQSYVHIYVNGESSYPEELAKPVKSGDELYVVFLVDGG